MRFLSLVVPLVLAACAGTYSSVSSPGVDAQQTAETPSTGSDARRDGFYDGGVYDPDLTRGNLPLSE